MPTTNSPAVVIRISADHDCPTCQTFAQQLSHQLHLPLDSQTNKTPPTKVDFLLLVTHDQEYDYRLQLQQTASRLLPLMVEFRHGALAHREKFGGGRGQPLARALGLKHGKSPNIVDLTAGLGRDGFVIAALGCKVQMVERNPILYQLLKDGVRRATLAGHPIFTEQQLLLQHGDSLDLLDKIPKNLRQVLYLDPMYPQRNKSALVKKEMRILRQLVGSDLDTESLLRSALEHAQQRVVVKRPKGATTLKGPSPSHHIESKNTRYDVYCV